MAINEHEASFWIQHLKLEKHPEGGYFREVYRCVEGVAPSALPPRFTGSRSFCTSIFYLLEAGDFSAFHRIRSDETWHFYAGGQLEVTMLSNAGYGQSNHVQPSICEASHKSTVITLGRAITVGDHLQYTVPAETWFASRPAAGVPFSLVGCTVSPGFDFNDFEMGSREALLNDFPNDREAILALTRS